MAFFMSFAAFLPVISPLPNRLAIESHGIHSEVTRSEPAVSPVSGTESHPAVHLASPAAPHFRLQDEMDEMSVFTAQDFGYPPTPPVYKPPLQSFNHSPRASEPAPVPAPAPAHSRHQDEIVEMSFSTAQDFDSSLSPPLYQPSPLGSHPLPPFPPPTYKRTRSPSPSTTSTQPSLHELPKYSPRPSISTTTSNTKPPQSSSSWTSWNPFHWPSSPSQPPKASPSKPRDPTAGHLGTELDAREAYEVTRRAESEASEGSGSNWCCGCIWVGPPVANVSLASFYMF